MPHKIQHKIRVQQNKKNVTRPCNNSTNPLPKKRVIKKFQPGNGVVRKIISTMKRDTKNLAQLKWGYDFFMILKIFVATPMTCIFIYRIQLIRPKIISLFPVSSRIFLEIFLLLNQSNLTFLRGLDKSVISKYLVSSKHQRCDIISEVKHIKVKKY